MTSTSTAIPLWRSRLGTKPIAFILGNEGGDMDSVVCAFMMSKLMSRLIVNLNSSASKYPLHHSQNWIVPLQNHVPVPVCNFPRADLNLRQDIILAFQDKSGFENEYLDTLMFTDDLPFLTGDESAAKVLSEQKDCIILVDHNIPCPSQEFLIPFVRGIVDHHALSSKPIKLPQSPAIASSTPLSSSTSSSSAQQSHHQHSEEINHRPLEIIETIGSAASLVTRLFAQPPSTIPLSANDAKLLLCPILLDTHNFDKKAEKAVEGDFKARDFLFSILSSYEHFFDSSSNNNDKEGGFGTETAKAWFNDLSEARESYEKLTIAEALKKDTKLFHFQLLDGTSLALPIASWGENLELHVLKRFKIEEIMEELVKFCQDRKADGSIAMFHKKQQRHFIYYAKTETCKKALSLFFHEHHKDKKNFETDITFTDMGKDLMNDVSTNSKMNKEDFGVYLFDRHQVSRKLLTPKLQEFFKGFKP